MTSDKGREWVAIMTFEDGAGMFYEAGGVYTNEPRREGMVGAREQATGGHVAVCPRCGQRFAAEKPPAFAP